MVFLVPWVSRDNKIGTEKQKDDAMKYQDHSSKRVSHINAGWDVAGNRIRPYQGGTTSQPTGEWIADNCLRF